jgi:hypothetical protein
MSVKGRADDPRGAAEAAIVAALEGGSSTLREVERATRVADGQIESYLTQLVEQGRVVRIEGEGEELYAMASLSAG